MPGQITESEYQYLVYLSAFPTSAPTAQLLQLPREDDTGYPVFAEGLALATMYYGAMNVYGDEGGGKTMFASSLGWRMKRIFRRDVISDYEFKPAFGGYTRWNWDDDDFMQELDMISEAAKKGQVHEKSMLHGKVAILDELYKRLHKRRGMAREAMLLGDLIKQRRHYDLLIIGIAPNPDELDDNLWIRRRTHDVKCQPKREEPGVSECVVINRKMRTGQTRDSYFSEVIELPWQKWGQLFYTDQPIAMRNIPGR